MKTSMRNLLLNLAAIGLLALFLVWAETNLDGYKVQILNLIAVNAILALSLTSSTASPGCSRSGTPGSWPSGPTFPPCACSPPPRRK